MSAVTLPLAPETVAALERIAVTRGFSGTISREDRDIIMTAARDADHRTVVTLDGHRAVVGGRSNDFALVSTLTDDKGPHYTIEFAWQSAAHIILAGGEFKS